MAMPSATESRDAVSFRRASRLRQSLWVGASRQLGEKGDLQGQCVFRDQPANDMTGVTAAGHRNSFAPDCIRHWQATKRHP
jgi:hypothetical protein